MARHLFLTGDKGAGKSTLLRTLLRHREGRIGGFRTVKQAGGVYLLRIGSDDAPQKDFLLFTCGGSVDPARFDALGCRALGTPCDVLVMDELGPHEADACAFQQAVMRALDGETPVFGVLQRAESDFLRRVARHPQVRVAEVTVENRDTLAAALRRVDTVDSYGAIVFAPSPRGAQVLMVRSLRGWSFPKGHPEPDETPPVTAQREIWEETGVRAVIDTGFVRTVPSIRPGDRRSVTFFAGCGDVAQTPMAQEVPDAAWVSAAEAAQRIVFPDDRAAFEAAWAYWQAGTHHA